MTRFTPDDALDYARSRTAFRTGEGLAMDEGYRRAHLPLVAPDHPAVIAEDAARGYAMGRHETAWSLVIPIDAGALEASPAMQRLKSELAAGPLAGKIAWESAARRRHLLHATICGGLGRGAAPLPDAAWRAAFRDAAPFRIALRGLFSGNINLGRLYLKLYPELQDGVNAIHRLQEALGRPRTSLYVVGLYNLVDDLDAEEAAWLSNLVAREWHVTYLEATVDRLWLLGARDDLALESEVAETLRLG